MNVEIGAETALFPEKEYIKGIFVAVLAIYVLIHTRLSLILPGVSFDVCCDKLWIQREVLELPELDVTLDSFDEQALE
jgi:hypothetical protein